MTDPKHFLQDTYAVAAAAFSRIMERLTGAEKFITELFSETAVPPPIPGLSSRSGEGLSL